MTRDSLRSMIGSSMGLRLGMALLNYGIFWWLSHRLSTQALGGFSLLMTIYLTVQLLPLLGLHTPLARRIAAGRDDVAAEVSNAVAMALPASVLIAALLVLAGRTGYPPELETPFVMLAASMLPGAWILVAETTLLGLERMVLIARVQFAEVLLRTMATVVVVNAGYGLVGVFGVFLALRVAVAAIYWWAPAVPRPRMALIAVAKASHNLRDVPMFLGIALLAAISSRLDVIVLSRVSGLEAVGVYTAASRLYDAALMLPTVAALALMPTLSRLFATEPERFRGVLVRSFRGSLAIGMLLALAVAALSDPIVRVLYRPEVWQAASVLRWLIFAAVLMAADQVLSTAMLSAMAQADDMKALAGNLVFLLLALLGLTWLMGRQGAAIAVLAAQVFRVSLRVGWASRTLGMRSLWREWLCQLAAGASGAAAVWVALKLDGAWAPAAACGLGWLAWLIVARCTGVLGGQWRARIRFAYRLVLRRPPA